MSKLDRLTDKLNDARVALSVAEDLSEREYWEQEISRLEQELNELRERMQR